MHLPNAVLSPAVAGVTLVIGAASVAVSSRLATKRLDEARLPMMGVMGAFVFAAQMVNFQILPGVSGHLGGGVLLAILLGPAPAIVVMSAILTIQCLVFNDGGLLALGANIVNMGVVPCLAGVACYRLALGRGRCVGNVRFHAAVFAGAFVGMIAGAALVPVEIAAGGVSAVPFTTLLVMMLAVHLIVAAAEGLNTEGVVTAVWRLRPELIDARAPSTPGKLSRAAVICTVIVVAFLVAGLLSLVASRHPDALESVQERAGISDKGAHSSARRLTAWQEHTAPLPGYGAPTQDGVTSPAAWTSMAGVIGTGATLLALYGIAFLVKRRRRRCGDPRAPG